MMNQEQREYTVKKIKKNKEESEKLTKEAVNQALRTGVATLVCTISATFLGAASDTLFVQTLGYVVLGGTFSASGLLAVSFLKDMVYSLAQKAGLEVMNEQLEYALSMDSLESGNQINDDEETKGRTR